MSSIKHKFTISHPIMYEDLIEFLKLCREYSIDNVKQLSDNECSVWFVNYNGQYVHRNRHKYPDHVPIIKNHLYINQHSHDIILYVKKEVLLNNYDFLNSFIINHCPHLSQFLNEHDIDFNRMTYYIYIPINPKESLYTINDLYKKYVDLLHNKMQLPNFMENSIALALICQKLYRLPAENDLRINIQYIKQSIFDPYFTNKTINDLYHDFKTSRMSLLPVQFSRHPKEIDIVFLNNIIATASTQEIYENLDDLRFLGYINNRLGADD